VKKGKMPVRTFIEEIKQAQINLPRAALSFAHEIAHPQLDVQAYLSRLDDMAEAAGERIPPSGTPAERAEGLADFLFVHLGFRGNSAEYSDPRNSYLNEVLDRRLGIPISLSVLYIALGQRLGLPVHGIGLPGHFIVSVPRAHGPLYLDPFHGGNRISVEDCARIVAETTGYTGVLQPEWFEPVSEIEILGRMLTNLRNIYAQHENWPTLLKVLERLALVQPAQGEHLRDLGIIHQSHGSLTQAVEYFRKYLTRHPQASDADLIKRKMQSAVEDLARLN
jgi:regulator of sirC expression with transglutaminase-like and TPR domain